MSHLSDASIFSKLSQSAFSKGETQLEKSRIAKSKKYDLLSEEAWERALNELDQAIATGEFSRPLSECEIEQIIFENQMM